jgi:hypothetical protein
MWVPLLSRGPVPYSPLEMNNFSPKIKINVDDNTITVFPGCDTVYFGRQEPTFQNNMMLSSADVSCT